jgi:hypothetical protein
VNEIKRHGTTKLARGARGLAAVLVVAVALALPAAAVAGGECSGPAGDQYCPPTEQILTGSGAGPSDAPPNGEPSGGLPFTGLDLGLVVAAGAGLLGAGLALRRMSSSRGAA